MRKERIIKVIECGGCNAIHQLATRQEQKRIIKLLESLKGTCDNDCDDCRPYADKNDHYLNEVIALIKGENK